VLDFSSVNNVDISSVQGLIDLRNTLDRYTAPAAVEWHFAGILNRWTRRTLAVAGFGYPSADNPNEVSNWCPAYTVASSLAGATDDDTRRAAAIHKNDEEKDNPHENGVSCDKRKEAPRESTPEGAETEKQTQSSSSSNGATPVGDERFAPVYGVDRPFFHIDVVDAVDAAVRDARRKDERDTN
jgi:solute carrier family 26 (sodium-independent sulfate anion transporter), member 11